MNGSGGMYLICKKKIVHLHAQLRYGVMVALQILVLSVQVRILVSQHREGGSFRHPLFYTLYTPKLLTPKPKPTLKPKLKRILAPHNIAVNGI